MLGQNKTHKIPLLGWSQVSPPQSRAETTHCFEGPSVRPQQQRMDNRLTWAVNLVEILKEELDEAGHALPADLTDQQLLTMPEAEIRAYYLPHTPQHNSSCGPKPGPLPQEQLARLQLQYPSQHGSAAFKAWFPSLFASRAPPPPAQPSAVVLCFHSSGNAEDMFTSEGTGSRWVEWVARLMHMTRCCSQYVWHLQSSRLAGLIGHRSGCSTHAPALWGCWNVPSHDVQARTVSTAGGMQGAQLAAAGTAAARQGPAPEGPTTQHTAGACTARGCPCHGVGSGSSGASS